MFDGLKAALTKVLADRPVNAVEALETSVLATPPAATLTVPLVPPAVSPLPRPLGRAPADPPHQHGMRNVLSRQRHCLVIPAGHVAPLSVPRCVQSAAAAAKTVATANLFG